MITENGKYYLYRHIRLDKNEPFYIGIGTKLTKYKNSKWNYSRAFSKTGRNIVWKRIVSKTTYEVEILLESDNYKFIKQKEIEFISLYGFLYNKTGILINMTLGGEGTIGYKRSPKDCEKIKERCSFKVYNKETNQIFNSITEAAKYENIAKSWLSIQIKKQQPNCKYQYYDKDKIKIYSNKVNRKIRQKSTQIIFDSMSKVIQLLDITYNQLYSILRDKNSDFESLTELPIKKSYTKGRQLSIIHIYSNITFTSGKEALKHSKLNMNLSTFMDKTNYLNNFEYCRCNNLGIKIDKIKRIRPYNKEKYEQRKKNKDRNSGL